MISIFLRKIERKIMNQFILVLLLIIFLGYILYIFIPVLVIGYIIYRVYKYNTQCTKE
jgi:hypothetical protein